MATWPDNAGRMYPFDEQSLGGGRRLSDVELLKLHLQSGHCIRRQLSKLVKFGRCTADSKQIDRLYKKCGRRRSVRRIAPPSVSSWLARFSGEIFAIDIIYPFAGEGPMGLFRKPYPITPALIAVDSMTRFATCALSKDLTSAEVSQTFMKDWAMHFGKPKRIILGQGGPGLTGEEWGR